jgi:hypothetical protein
MRATCMRYRSDFENEWNRGLLEIIRFLRTRSYVTMWQKLHTTMWQSPIKVVGADHAV